MTKRSALILSVVVAVAAFAVGVLMNRGSGRSPDSGSRKILYYVDPMHPAYRSDKPGIAPDCGMQLEPVYADGGAPGSAEAVPASLPPGTVKIPPERQQLIGIRTAVVARSSAGHTLRVLGKVTPDETRVYKINAAVEGWVKQISPVTTGSLVREDQVLAIMYATEFYSSINAFIQLIEATERQKGALEKNEYARYKYDLNFNNARNLLRNYGMSDAQIAEIERTKIVTENIEIRSPATGFVLARNIFSGQRFEKNQEFYRIADLSRVWVLADLYENEAGIFKPGMIVTVEVPNQNRKYAARVSTTLPLFDAATRTLKVRLELDNPGLVLRPDMFVNVEVPVSAPEMIIVPTDAVLDSGVRKTVFVDRGNGFFEPRPVETGRFLGDRVEIRHGLTVGEKIVVSGNFLIDSETRLKNATAGIFGKPGRDPVCGMALDEDRAKAAGLTRQHEGKAWYFCSPEDMAKFDKSPKRYTGPGAVAEPMAMPHPGSNKVNLGGPAYDFTPAPKEHLKFPTRVTLPPMPDKAAPPVKTPTTDATGRDMTVPRVKTYIPPRDGRPATPDMPAGTSAMPPGDDGDEELPPPKEASGDPMEFMKKPGGMSHDK